MTFVPMHWQICQCVSEAGLMFAEAASMLFYKANDVITIEHSLATLNIVSKTFLPGGLLRQVEELLDAYAEGDYKDDYYLMGKRRWEPHKALILYRIRRNLSQSRLAKLAGMDSADISKLENQKRPFSRKVALKLAKALGCDHRELL